MGFVLRVQGVGGAAVSPEILVNFLLHLDREVSLEIPEMHVLEKFLNSNYHRLTF